MDNFTQTIAHHHREISSTLLAALLPVIFTILWLSCNSQLPTADATDYLATGHTIYHHFTDNGFWSGLLNFDLARGWRPIFFSVLTVPFLFISHGNVEFAFQATAILCVAASAIYVYLLSRLLLDRVSSVIAANLICLLPLVQLPVLIFFAECALFPAIIGTIYHLIQSDYFRRRSHTLGFVICFSLAIVIRPIEAVTECVFILMLFLTSGWYQKIFTLKQIVSVIALGFTAIFLLLFYTGSHFIHHFPFRAIDGGEYDIKLAQSIYLTSFIAMGVMVFAWLVLAWMNFSSWYRKHATANRALNDPPIIWVFVGIFILGLMWFLPHAFQTYVWIYRTSFGDLAVITAKTQGRVHAWPVLFNFAKQESLVIVVGALLLALIAAFTLGKNKIKDILVSRPIIYLLLLIPFPLWEVLKTVQNAPRKMNLAFPALILVLLLIALQRGRGWKLRCSLVTCLLMMQFLFAVDFLFPTVSLHQYTKLFGGYLQPIRIKPNPHDEVLSFFGVKAKEYSLKYIALIVNPETVLPIDPYLLSMMYQIKHLTFEAGMPYYSDYSEEHIHSIHDGHDAVFLADKKSSMVISAEAVKAYDEKFQKETNPTLKIQYRLLMLYSGNKLSTMGWTPASCMVVKAMDGEAYQGCLLVKGNINR
jgi:hypothetical protein